MKKRFVLFAIVAVTLSGISLLHRAVSAQTAPRRIEISAKRFTFDPSEITLAKGQPVVLALTSEDVAHGLSVPELNVDITVSKHGTTEVQLTPDQIGDFVAHCSVFCGAGHGSMMLTIHVVE